MKKLQLVLLLLCLAVSASYAQNDTIEFYLTIPDKSIIAQVDHVGSNIVPVFYDQGINDIIDNYDITVWKKAFPTSEYEDMRWIYYVRCNSIQLGQDLINYNHTLFPEYQAIHKELCATPSDFTGWNGQVQLNYINAPMAWDYSTGNPNVVIGVTDIYFDLNHEDMQGKYAQVRDTFNSWGADWYHGTAVAGLIAAKTNNGGTGMASVGYNCRVDVSTNWADDNELLSMSQQGRRILNASWRNGVEPSVNYYDGYYSQPIYDEIYENGTFMVAAAGNDRKKGTTPAKNTQHSFPASMDHNFSVTSVGFENDTSNVAGIFNAKDVHEIVAGDSTNAFQHNDRVDLCAPGVRLSMLYYDRPTPQNYQWMGSDGTSFSAPLVAGTAGLMLSANPWMSPYQLEYLLKVSARNIYDNQFNVKYRHPSYPSNPDAQHWGRLGSGVLNAGQAVYVAADYYLDDPATKTFIVQGIDVNTLCAPGIASNGAYPILDVRLKNGTPPYIYRWDTIAGNEVTISSLSSDKPSVTSYKGNGLLHYRLTVYDNSPIQKVANRIIKFNLITDNTKYDLAMQDHFSDMLDERNTMDLVNPRWWDIWASPDLINRIGSAGSSMVHQNPIYDSSNYVRVKIRNVGCTDAPEAKVHLYWSVPSTGETWPQDWKGQGPLVNGQPGGGNITPPTGQIFTSLAPGTSTIVTYPWTDPPRPQDYDTSGTLTSMEACLLARIVEDVAPDSGMHNEQINVNSKENVWENNNVVTRNFIVTNFSGAERNHKKFVVIGNGSTSPNTFTIELLTEKDIQKHYAGNLSRYLTATLHLGDLFDVWANGGYEGNATDYDAQNKTVTYDLTKPLRLENIHLMATDRYPVIIEFNMKNSVSVPYKVEDQLIHLRQLTHYQEDIDMGDGTTTSRTRDLVHGAITFAINIEADEAGNKPSTVAQAKKTPAAFNVYPNPAKDKLVVVSLQNETQLKFMSVTDMTGRLVMTRNNVSLTDSKYEVNIKPLNPGMYFIKLIDSKGLSHSMKFVKAE